MSLGRKTKRGVAAPELIRAAIVRLEQIRLETKGEKPSVDLLITPEGFGLSIVTPSTSQPAGRLLRLHHHSQQLNPDQLGAYYSVNNEYIAKYPEKVAADIEAFLNDVYAQFVENKVPPYDYEFDENKKPGDTDDEAAELLRTVYPDVYALVVENENEEPPYEFDEKTAARIQAAAELIRTVYPDLYAQFVENKEPPYKFDENKKPGYTEDTRPSGPADTSGHERMGVNFNTAVKKAKAENLARAKPRPKPRSSTLQLATYRALVQNVDLLNPELPADERLTRARRLVRAYHRVRERRPKFQDRNEQLQAAFSIVNRFEYQQKLRREAALKLAVG